MKTHRSLHAWKEARLVSLGAIEAAKLHWKPWAAALYSQLLRASASVQLNLAEGSAFGPSRTYVRHLTIAYGSAVETIEIIELMIESSTIPDQPGQQLLVHAERSRQLLVGLLKHHRGKGRTEKAGHEMRS
jgi:four helix bundle protein